MGKEPLAIKEELNRRNIDFLGFEKFYDELYGGRGLPDGGNFNYKQYSSIVDYLMGKSVLDKKGYIDAGGLSLFDGQKKLEARMEMTAIEMMEVAGGARGGVMPCRRETGRGGGVMSCR